MALNIFQNRKKKKEEKQQNTVQNKTAPQVKNTVRNTVTTAARNKAGQLTGQQNGTRNAANTGGRRATTPAAPQSASTRQQRQENRAAAEREAFRSVRGQAPDVYTSKTGKMEQGKPLTAGQELGQAILAAEERERNQTAIATLTREGAVTEQVDRLKPQVKEARQEARQARMDTLVSAAAAGTIHGSGKGAVSGRDALLEAARQSGADRQKALDKADQLANARDREWYTNRQKAYGNLSSNPGYDVLSRQIDDRVDAGKDLAYAYINGDTRAADIALAMTKTGNNPLSKYDYMTPDEKADYRYVYNTMGKEQADDYLEYLSYTLNARQAGANETIWAEEAREAPIMASAASVGMNAMSGAGFADAALQMATKRSNDYKPVDFNRAGAAPSQMVNAVRGTIAGDLEDQGHGGAAFLYQTGMSMADSLFAMMTGGIGGAGAAARSATNIGTVLLGGAAATSAMQTAAANGATDRQAFGVGLAAGIAETLFEKVSLDMLLKSGGADTAGKLILSVLKNAGVEGSEEGFTTLANTIAEALILGDKSSYNASVRDYIAQGYSPEEAKKQASKDWGRQLLSDIFGGAISGGVFGGAYSGAGYMAQSVIDRQAGRDLERYAPVEGKAALLEQGRESAEGTRASEFTKKLDAGGHVSDRDAGRLARYVEEEKRRESLRERARDAAIGENGTKALGDFYDGEPDSAAYFAAFTSYWNAGHDGRSVNDVETPYKGTLTAAVKRAAWNAGKMDAVQESAQAQTETEKAAAADMQQAAESAAETRQENVPTDLYQSMETPTTQEQDVEAVATAGVEQTGQEVQTPRAAEAVVQTRPAGSEAVQTSVPAVRNGAYQPVRRADAGLTMDEYVTGKMDRKTAAEMNEAAKQLGFRVDMVDLVNGGRANAEMREDGIMQIEKDNPNPLRSLYGHESGHWMARMAPKEWAQFQDYVLGLKGMAEQVQAKIGHYAANGVTLTRAKAREEIACNFAGDLAEDHDLLEQFIRDNRNNKGLLQRFMEALRELARKLTGQHRTEIEEAIRRLENAYSATVEAAAKAETATENAATEGGVSSSYNLKYSGYGAKLKGMNPQDVAAIQRIGKKRGRISVNDFTRADLAETYRLAQGYWKDMGAKSPFFRAWFGDWRVNDQTPVQVADQKGDTRGVQHNDDTNWDINVYGQVFNETKVHTHQQNIRARAYLPYINDIVRKAVLLDSFTMDNPKNTSSLLMHNLYAVADIGNGPELLRLYVVETNDELADKTLKKAYQLQNIEIAPVASVRVQGNSLTSVVPATNAIHTVADLFAAVKGREKNFKPRPPSVVVDENGAPLVVYHGTSERFTVFDPTKGRSTMDIQGMFFSPWEIEAGGYGENVGAYYLAIKKPADEATAYKALNRFKGQNNAGVKAREYLISLGYDGVVGYDEYIAFYPEQIKSATDNVGTFDAEDPDVNYSLKGDDYNTRKLEQENAELKELVEYWKSQTKRTERATTDKKAVRAAARELIRTYGADLDAEDVAGPLQELYDFITSGRSGKDELTYEAVRERAKAIARDLVENAVEQDNILYEEYEDLRYYLRTTQILVTPRDAADCHDFSSRRKDLGRYIRIRQVKAGERSNVDDVFDECSNRFPSLFPEENYTDPLETIMAAAEAVTTVTERNPFQGYEDQAVEMVANEILDRFWDLPQTKQTYADRMEKKLVQERIRTREAKEAGREAAAAARLGERMAGGRELAAYKRKSKEATARAINALKEKNRDLQEEMQLRVQAAALGEKIAGAKELAAYKRKVRQQNAERRERQNARELRARIIRHANKLSGKLLRPNDKQHIPEELRGAVAAVLHAINLESKRDSPKGGPTARTQAFQQLRTAYETILRDPETELIIDPDLMDNIHTVLDRNAQNTPIADMNAKQLGAIMDILNAVEASVKNAGRAFALARFATIEETAKAIRNENAGRKPRDVYKGTLGQIDRLLNVSMLTPETYFHMLGDTGYSVFKGLRQAQDKYITILQEAQKEMEELRRRNREIRDWEREVHTFEVDNYIGDAEQTLLPTDQTATETKKETLRMTTAQIMDLYLLMKRDQAKDHILVGGVRPEAVRKGAAKLETRAKPVHLTAEDLTRIIGTLTDDQRAIADQLQKYTETVLADLGNEASMQIYGYKKFRDAHYWPIRSDRNQVHTDVAKEAQSATIAGRGFTKGTMPHANNAVRLGSVFDVFADHASDMATYAAWLAPMEDLRRIYNFSFRQDGLLTGNVKEVIETVFGPNGKKYWETLTKHLNNGVKGTDSEGINLMGAYKASAIGANIRVWVQQPTSILRAMESINPIDMAAAAGRIRPGIWKTVQKYSPIAVWKSWGYFETSTGRSMKEVLFGDTSRLNSVNNKLMAPAGTMDTVAWCYLWAALENETARKHKDLKRGTDAFYQAVAERFNDVVDHTQVVDGTLQRSQIMRNTNGITQMATSFMSEPTKIYNMAYSALWDLRHAKTAETRKTATKVLGRTTFALLCSFAANAAAQSLVDALRDDDRDKDFWQKFWTKMTGRMTTEEAESAEKGDRVKAFIGSNAGDALMPWNYVPFIKDMASILQGYSVDRMDMESMESLLKAAQGAIKAFQEKSGKTKVNALVSLIADGSRVFGLPLANIKRDILAVLTTVAIQSDNYQMQYAITKTLYRPDYSGNQGKYKDILRDAYTQGDVASARGLREQMIADGVKEEWLKAPLLDALYEAYKEQNSRYDALYDEAISINMTDKDITNAISDRLSKDKGDDYDAKAAVRMRDAGLSQEKADRVASAVGQLTPPKGEDRPTTTQKYRAVCGTLSSEQDRYNAMVAVSQSKEERQNVTVAYQTGVPMEAYTYALEHRSQYDTDANGYINQGEYTALINGMIQSGQISDLNTAAALWQAISTSTKTSKNNPYNRAVGEMVLNTRSQVKETVT